MGPLRGIFQNLLDRSASEEDPRFQKRDLRHPSRGQGGTAPPMVGPLSGFRRTSRLICPRLE